jgi:Mg/Co/Ni transporter MgtE
VAASVIGWYQETLSAAIALAVFLPVISGMGGNSGNQALAVSIRELSLGLVQPQEFLWVVLKEVSVGLTNGLFLGLAVATLCFAWQGSARLSVVVGAAIALNIVVAACLGGIVPLCSNAGVSIQRLPPAPSWPRSTTSVALYSHLRWPICCCQRRPSCAVSELATQT